MNLLIIEDEPVIREGTAAFLREQGFSVYEAGDGEEGIAKFCSEQIHLVILDIMLPGKNGIEILKEIRKSSQVPILMLTAISDEQTQVKSFDALADDYVSKPFSLILLQKRIEALLRSHYPQLDLWCYGAAVVDFSGFHASYEGKDADIKPMELKLLSVLLAHGGQVLSREQILDQIWGEEEAPFDRVVDVYIKNLRKKLHLDCIITVKNVGYKIEL